MTVPIIRGVSFLPFPSGPMTLSWELLAEKYSKKWHENTNRTDKLSLRHSFLVNGPLISILETFKKQSKPEKNTFENFLVLNYFSLIISKCSLWWFIITQNKLNTERLEPLHTKTDLKFNLRLNTNTSEKSTRLDITPTSIITITTITTITIIIIIIIIIR